MEGLEYWPTRRPFDLNLTLKLWTYWKIAYKVIVFAPGSCFKDLSKIPRRKSGNPNHKTQMYFDLIAFSICKRGGGVLPGKTQVAKNIRAGNFKTGKSCKKRHQQGGKIIIYRGCKVLKRGKARARCKKSINWAEKGGGWELAGEAMLGCASSAPANNWKTSTHCKTKNKKHSIFCL